MKKRISGTTTKGIPLINENNVADINQVNESLQKIDELLGNNQELNRHKNLSIINENGVHNLKYDPITKSFYYNQGGEWLAVELEGTGNVSVSGLTSDVLKTGVTAIVKQGEKEVKRVTGTFTSDATATANHIAPGRTAYVNGNKLTGTFTNDANATASDIVSGKTAYVRGSKITGTLAGKPLASISGCVYQRDGTNMEVHLTIKSLDNNFLTDTDIYWITNTGSSLPSVAFRRNAKIIAYGYRKNNAISFPWSNQIPSLQSSYAINYNITTADRIYLNHPNNAIGYLITALICEVG